MSQNSLLDENTVIFKKYERDHGFEDIQAFIYNEAVKPYHGDPVTGEAIANRLQNHRPEQDSKAITFAFSPDNQPLAYIQYREYANGRVYIGFPWSIPGTPAWIPDKLYADMFSYLQTKYPDKQDLFFGFVNKDYSHAIEKVKLLGFTQSDWTATYRVSHAKILPLNDSSYTYKIATPDDLSSIVTICLSDQSVSGMGKETLERFVKRNLLETDQHSVTILLQKDGLDIAVFGLAYGDEDDFLGGRLIAVLKTYENSFSALLGALAKILQEKNLLKDITMPVDDSVKYQRDVLESLGASVESKTLEFKKTFH